MINPDERKEYIANFTKWIEENKIEVGSYVKVLCKADSYQWGWYDIWNSEMDTMVGSIYPVINITNSLDSSGHGYEIVLKSESNWKFYFPYFILEPINEENFIIEESD